MQLKAQVGWVIAMLAFVPNIVVVLIIAGQYGIGLRDLWWWMLLVAGASAGSGWLLSGILLKPLEELRFGVRLLKESDRPIAELGLRRAQHNEPLEVAALRRDFEDMLAKVKTLNASREAVYGTLAHDLKTPLLASVRVLEQIEQGLITDHKAAVSMVRQELQHSYHMVENLLLMSRLETQTFSFETLSVRSILEEMHLRYGALGVQVGLLAETKSNALQLHIEGGGHIQGHKLLLERALINLLDNAFRYAQHKVVLRGSDQGFEVCDDGPGLNATLEQLTQPFYSQRQQGRMGSAGLGLFVVKRVAEIHSGSLCSLEVAQGACLRLSLSKHPQQR